MGEVSKPCAVCIAEQDPDGCWPIGPTDVYEACADKFHRQAWQDRLDDLYQHEIRELTEEYGPRRGVWPPYVG